MKILHVIANLSPRKGDPSEAAPLMCRAVAKLGHTVSLYTTNADGKGILDVPVDRPVIKDGVKMTLFAQTERAELIINKSGSQLKEGTDEI